MCVCVYYVSVCVCVCVCVRVCKWCVSVSLWCVCYVGCLRQPTLPLSIRINTGSLYRNVSILNYKRDKDNVS